MMAMKQGVKVGSMEETAQKVADVLAGHGVFGPQDDKWSQHEKAAFVTQVVNHAAEGGIHYLELTYMSGVRVILHTTIKDGVASFRDMECYDHPWPNPKMDYEGLNRDVQRVLAKK